MKNRALSLTAVLTLTGVLVLTSCGRDTTRAFADQFIRAENKAWGTGDLRDLKTVEAADVIYHLPGGGDLVGWKAHEGYIVNSRPTVSDLHQSWRYLTGEADHFALSYASSAVARGDHDSPTRRVSNSYLFVFRVHDGKIAEVWANGSSTSTPVKDDFQ